MTLRVDEIGIRAQPVDQRQQARAGQPRRIGFPLPDQWGSPTAARLPDRSEYFWLHVESAAVHRPQLAENATPGVAPARSARQRIVQHHEVERRADPRDPDAIKCSQRAARFSQSRT